MIVQTEQKKRFSIVLTFILIVAIMHDLLLSPVIRARGVDRVRSIPLFVSRETVEVIMPGE